MTKDKSPPVSDTNGVVNSVDKGLGIACSQSSKLTTSSCTKNISSDNINPISLKFTKNLSIDDIVNADLLI